MVFLSSEYGGYSTAGLSQSTCSWKSPGAEADTFTGANEVAKENVVRMLKRNPFVKRITRYSMWERKANTAWKNASLSPLQKLFLNTTEAIGCTNHDVVTLSYKSIGTQINNFSCRYELNMAEEVRLTEQAKDFQMFQLFVVISLRSIMDLIRKQFDAVCIFANRARSIHQYSNMALRLSGQTSIFGGVFFCILCLFWELRNKRNFRKKYNFDPTASEPCYRHLPA